MLLLLKKIEELKPDEGPDSGDVSESELNFFLFCGDSTADSFILVIVIDEALGDVTNFLHLIRGASSIRLFLAGDESGELDTDVEALLVDDKSEKTVVSSLLVSVICF